MIRVLLAVGAAIAVGVLVTLLYCCWSLEPTQVKATFAFVFFTSLAFCGCRKLQQPA